MTGNKTLLIGAVAIIVVLLSGTLYVALSSGGANQANGTTQTGTTGTVVNSNSTARIVVSGTGTVSYVPDEAIVSVGVITESTTVIQATNSNSVTTSSIINALNAIGISNSSMQTQDYNIAPNYNYNDNNGTQSITGYTVTDTLNVNVTNDACAQCAGGIVPLGQLVAQVMDTATQAGANQVSFGFTVSNQVVKQLETQALQQAVLDASNQATTIAGAMGVTISGVIQATDTGVSVPQAVNGIGIQSAISSSPSITILPGTSTVSASVEIVYAIS
jgi:uncharacterized protein YggE